MRFSCLCVCARVLHVHATRRWRWPRNESRAGGSFRGRLGAGPPSPPSSLPILHAGLLGLSFPA